MARKKNKSITREVEENVLSPIPNDGEVEEIVKETSTESPKKLAKQYTVNQFCGIRGISGLDLQVAFKFFGNTGTKSITEWEEAFKDKKISV